MQDEPFQARPDDHLVEPMFDALALRADTGTDAGVATDTGRASRGRLPFALLVVLGAASVLFFVL